MPLVFGVIVDVFLAEAAEEHAVETGVESVQVGPTDMTDTRLGLWEGRRTKGGGQRIRSVRGKTCIKTGQLSSNLIGGTA